MNLRWTSLVPQMAQKQGMRRLGRRLTACGEISELPDYSYSRAGFYAQLIHHRNGMVRKHLNSYGKHIASSYPSLWLSAALRLELKRLPYGSEAVFCSPHPHHLDRARKTLDARINDVFAYD